MQRLIRSIWQESGATVVFVTHNLAEAVFLGSRVLLIAKDQGAESSRIALDLDVPDRMRHPDGSPKQEDLERIMHRLEVGALEKPLAALVEFAE
jgi:ABC-type nitrate/sulfonate/bicarbonate transport system ATPase subunit